MKDDSKASRNGRMDLLFPEVGDAVRGAPFLEYQGLRLGSVRCDMTVSPQVQMCVRSVAYTVWSGEEGSELDLEICALSAHWCH